MKLWAGRFQKEIDQKTNDFNSSIAFDSRMAQEDIAGSMAHAAMLAQQGILSAADGEAIRDGLAGIAADLRAGTLIIDPQAEDIHTFIEGELTARIGDAGKRLHTGRSRNDQVALDIRLYLRGAVAPLRGQLCDLIRVLSDKALTHAGTIMPGYTHLQRAQPITFGHHLLAYAEMFLRDIGRLDDAAARMNVSPLGSSALASTTYPLDREAVAAALGMDGVTANSLDGVSDRDFAVELAAALSLVMVHLSRFSEEIILWCSWEFKFIELDDAFSTGSSIMPQKKNPDVAELVRGKTGRVYGALVSLLTTMKSLPLAYNKDMQEDKEAVFDAVDTVKQCLTVFAPMITTMKVLPDNMYKAAQKGFINATDLADYLVKKGMPFRTAYKKVGEIVAYCIENGLVLETVPIEKYKELDSLFDNDLYNEISLETCVSKRISAGGTGERSVEAQIAYLTEFLH